jgi:hypothetical protein
MGMTGHERKTWLSQITRIHREQMQQRQKEALEQAERIITAREEG